MTGLEFCDRMADLIGSENWSKGARRAARSTFPFSILVCAMWAGACALIGMVGGVLIGALWTFPKFMWDQFGEGAS